MLTIRAAAADDEVAVLALLPELFDPPGRRPAAYSARRGAVGFRHAVASPDADVLLAVDGAAVVGMASVYAHYPSMRFGRRAWLEDLVVTAARRGEGVGARLLDAVVDWARAHGCTEIELTSAAGRRDAHRFYRTHDLEERQALFHRDLAPGS